MGAESENADPTMRCAPVKRAAATPKRTGAGSALLGSYPTKMGLGMERPRIGDGPGSSRAAARRPSPDRGDLDDPPRRRPPRPLRWPQVETAGRAGPGPPRLSPVRAVVYDAFGEMPQVETVPDPAPTEHGAVVRVHATGLCRSDWHGWMGHDPDIVRLPHVPGHELAGVVEAVGARVERWAPGDRVTVPFVCACGTCAQCAAGQHQVCDRQTQPGFTHWGSFAELVAIDWADVNLVALPDDLDADAAAALGCRFATAYRAVLQVGRLRAGEWRAVHGCGGVGLSAVMIAAAAGARVIALDVVEAALDWAREAGAELAVTAGSD